MSSENKTWQTVKAEYLRQVEKALSSVEHPRRNEVLEDVTAHLDGRFAELAPDQQTCKNFQKIITEMGPASDHAELLGPAAAKAPAITGKHLFWFGLALILIISTAVLLPRLGSPTVGYIIAFRPVEPFAPQTASQLLAAFNQSHPRGARRHQQKEECDRFLNAIHISLPLCSKQDHIPCYGSLFAVRICVNLKFSRACANIYQTDKDNLRNKVST